MRAKRKTAKRGHRSRHKANSRPAKAHLPHFSRSDGAKQGKRGKSQIRRPGLGSLVQTLPLPGYQPSQFILPYIGKIGKVVGYQKNYNSVKVQFADGFTLGHNPDSLRRAG